MIINGFGEKYEHSKITYVIGAYSTIQGRWYPCAEFENIEEAQDKLNDLCQRKYGKFAIFERIRSEILTKLN